MEYAVLKSPVNWLIGLLATYLLGNLGAFLLCRYLVNRNLSFTYVIPFVFLLVPISTMVIGRAGRLLDKSSRFRNLAVYLLLLSVLTWLVVLYIFLKNLYPTVF